MVMLLMLMIIIKIMKIKTIVVMMMMAMMMMITQYFDTYLEMCVDVIVLCVKSTSSCTFQRRFIGPG